MVLFPSSHLYNHGRKMVKENFILPMLKKVPQLEIVSQLYCEGFKNWEFLTYLL